MPAIHRHSDARTCGATTVVVGNNTVYSNNILNSVYGDPNTHGGGALLATVNPGTVFIHNLEMVVVGSEANCDALLHCGGADASAAGSPNVFAFDGDDGTEGNEMACENEPLPLPVEAQETYTPINATPGGARNPDPVVLPEDSTGGPFAPVDQGNAANAGIEGRDATTRGETVPGAGLDTTLGALSSRYESNGNPGAVGFDRNGGYSYGEYQIATNTGTMDSYMNYLRINSPRTYAQLQAAGGAQGARNGSQGFQSAWQTLMANPEHARTQHDFIQATHYIPASRSIQNRTGIDLATRSKTLRDVAWSTSVQHGGASDNIFQRALQRTGKTANTVTDAELISAVYAERGRRNADGQLAYFTSSTRNVQTSVANRFINEERDAQNALSAEGGSN